MSRKSMHWQNLIHRKCPCCETRLVESGQYIRCPNESRGTADRDCFFIKKSKMCELLLDHRHPANRFLSDDEHAMVEMVVGSLR